MKLARARTIVALTGIVVTGACSSPTPKPADERPADAVAVTPADPRSMPDVAEAAPRSGLAVENPYAYIPPQCYVKTRDDAGGVHNPCFACHVQSRSPNFIDDADLQLAYDFAEPARRNPWTNAFVDRRAAIAAIPDAEILAWVRTDNYFDGKGGITLAQTLAHVPDSWDANRNGTWDGYVPDCWFHFDASGFDHAPGGEPTGWRAYQAYPFPGQFLPTQGSIGDFLIRLPAAYREHEDGRADPAVHALNLAIVETLMTRRDVVIVPTDEAPFGVDLDRDGKLGTATKVVFHYAPLQGKTMSYVGRAKTLPKQEAPIAAGLLPLGTELLHTLRYLDVDASGRVVPSARMKEVRYARKRSWRTYGQLEQASASETKEKRDFPSRLREVFGNVEVGAFNGQGWVYQAFIEDPTGALRPQTFEETMACVGCHSGVGVTFDGTFSLSRKVPDGQPGEAWTHPSQRIGVPLPEPVRKDGIGEYAFYLEQAGGADDLRSNDEVYARFFDDSGKLRPEALAELRNDIAVLVLPSPTRALALDRAYRELVREQSFIRGRDAQLTPATNAWQEVPDGEETGVREPVR